MTDTAGDTEMSPAFTYPFRYLPSKEIMEAAGRVISFIDSSGELSDTFGEGKMMGVLTVIPGKGMSDEDRIIHRLSDGTAYLAAFSGIAGGQSRISGFVPPVFDLTVPEGHFKKEEARISAINSEIRLLEGKPDLSEKSALLKAERRRMSDDLQKWIFSQYRVINGRGESASILDIFAEKGLVPPGGTGDCAAPKLLQYAYSHNLVPVAMGEFWYCSQREGSVLNSGRRKGEFCPSCSSKCGPLLRWMMKGLKVDNPYGFNEDTVPETIWEDEWMMALDKPAGMLCVPGKDGQKSLIERLRQPVYSVHRLDMDTSGVLLAAKSLRIQSSLQRQFEDRLVKKTYTAILENRKGLKPGDSGIISLPLRPDIDDRPRQIVDHIYGREAVTEYEVLSAAHDISVSAGCVNLVKVRFNPLTGRTHQLRVHSAEGLGCPILGDLLYGGSFYRRMCLHAESISFTHPVTGKGMHFCIPSRF